MTTTRDNRFYPGYHPCFLNISRACLNQYYKLLMILLDQQQRRNENPINPSWHKSWVAQFGPQGVPSSLTPDIFLVLLFPLFPTGSLAPSQKSQRPIYCTPASGFITDPCKAGCLGTCIAHIIEMYHKISLRIKFA